MLTSVPVDYFQFSKHILKEQGVYISYFNQSILLGIDKSITGNVSVML
ncbi:MAG: hypothetical protein R3A12_14385 [Ignavibacteria bacterium]